MIRGNRKRYQPRRRRGTGRNFRRVLTKLGFLLTIMVVVGGIGLFCYGVLGQSRFFQIVAIEIDGCQRISEKDVLELSGVDVHSNLVKLNVTQVKNLLERHNWIERVVITREWPDRLTISIKERNPVAIINLNDGLHYVDRTAKIFAPVEAMADLDYPVITGLDVESDQRQTENPALQDALLFIKYASRDNPNLPIQNISEISIRNNNMVLFLMDRPFPIHLGQGDIWQKYKRLAKVLYWLYKRKEFDRVSYVNYLNDKVLVGMGSI